MSFQKKKKKKKKKKLAALSLGSLYLNKVKLWIRTGQPGVSVMRLDGISQHVSGRTISAKQH